MVESLDLPVILLVALVAIISPGPATLGIAGTSMASGRLLGLGLASGVSSGSLMWSTAAAFGLGAIMQANAWVFEFVRYAAVAYLLFLAFKSARAALFPTEATLAGVHPKSYSSAFWRGVMLHLTNPKPILFFGSLFAIGVPQGASAATLATVVLAVGLQSALVFHLYAVIFSSGPVAGFYVRAKRWMDGIFAIAFGAVGLRILTARLT